MLVGRWPHRTDIQCTYVPSLATTVAQGCDEVCHQAALSRSNGTLLSPSRSSPSVCWRVSARLIATPAGPAFLHRARVLMSRHRGGVFCHSMSMSRLWVPVRTGCLPVHISWTRGCASEFSAMPCPSGRKRCRRGCFFDPPESHRRSPILDKLLRWRHTRLRRERPPRLQFHSQRSWATANGSTRSLERLSTADRCCPSRAPIRATS
jgi:hypothetical protein